MATSEMIFPENEIASKLLQWKVAEGTTVDAGRILFLYKNLSSDSKDTIGPEKKYRATQFGKIVSLLIKQGGHIRPGESVVALEKCQHSTVMKDLCAECGVDLREESLGIENNLPSRASVPMIHSVPELKVTPEIAMEIGKQDIERLLQDKKLALLVDLDQTLVHTTNDDVPVNMKDVYHYQLYGPNSPWYHTRLRPNTHHFLLEMSKYYELHICTFGTRNYAHRVTKILDKDGVLFSHRILSRDECFDPLSKKANLKALFPCGDDMVCIIDDREDVWQGCGNLVQVKPYHFFRHTGDIHAPIGLGKNEDIVEPTDLPDMEDPADEETTVEANIENGKVLSAAEETREKNKDRETKFGNIPSIDLLKSGDKSENANKQSTNNSGEQLVKKSDEKKEDSEMKDSEMKDSEMKDSEMKDSEMKDSEMKDSEMKDSEMKDSEMKDSEMKDSEMKDSEMKDSEMKDSEMKDGEIKDDEIKDIEMKDSEMKAEGEQKIEKDGVENTEKREEIVDEDHDDYLLYLEDILKRIYKEFYQNLDKETEKRSLREVIPRIRARVLKGVHITFSGMIPIHHKMEDIQAYKVAKAFGAEVYQDLVDQTTHLVAVRPGTAKVYWAKKNSKIKVVNPRWLWTCAERWEHVDERLYPLEPKAHGTYNYWVPPPQCSNPERSKGKSAVKPESFANSINPLLSFSREEIDNMDKEVDEDMEDLEMDDNYDIEDKEESDSNNEWEGREYDNENEGDEDEDEYIEVDERGFKRTLSNSEWLNEESKKRKLNESSSSSSESDEDPVTKFRRGEGLPDDLDLGDPSSQPSVDELDNDDLEDDSEWNAMGAALEREFLSE